VRACICNLIAGRFGTSSRGDSEIFGFWLPPLDGGVCFVTMHAVNGDGLATTVTAALVAHAGTAPTARPPAPFANLENGCMFGSPDSPPDCGSVTVASQRTLFGSVFWDDGHPGSVTITDDCVGPLPDPSNAAFFSSSWLTSASPADTCTVTLRAVDLEGVATSIAAQYHVVAPGG
jgi:hypothetical protein